MEYLTTPAGRVRVPETLREGGFTQNHSVLWRGEVVDIYFWADALAADPIAEWTDDAVGEVVAHVFMTREHFEHLPATLAAMIRLNGDELRGEMP